MPGQSVLVVEDTDEIRELVVTVLRRAGMDVREAVSGDARLAALRGIHHAPPTRHRGPRPRHGPPAKPRPGPPPTPRGPPPQRRGGGGGGGRAGAGGGGRRRRMR